MAIKGIALDAEGTMFDFEKDGHHAAHRKVAMDLGMDLTALEALEEIPNLVGGPGKLIAQQIYDLAVRRTGGSRMTPEKIEERSRKYFRELLGEIASGQRRIDWRPGLEAAIFNFRQNLHLPVVVGSSTWMEEFWIYWIRTGLEREFPHDKVVLASDANGIRHKPEPDIFIKTAELMGIDPREQLVFEDSQRGVQAGVAAGSTVIGVTTYAHTREIVRLYETGAKRVYCDWREINISNLIKILNGE